MAWRRLLLLVTDLLCVLLFAGVMFGQPALGRLLQAHGSFSGACSTPQRGHPCVEQEAALKMVFAVATTAVYAAALPAGWLVDSCGPLLTTMVGGAFAVLGQLGLALGIGLAMDGLVATSVVCLAVGGAVIFSASFKMPFLFPAKATLLCAIVNCLSNGSAIVFPVLELLTEAGWDLQVAAWAYAGAGAVLVPLLLLAWGLNRGALQQALRVAPARTARAPAGGQRAPESAKPGAAEAAGASCEASGRLQPGQAPGGLASQPLFRQLRSPEFLVVLLFCAVEFPRATLYVSTVELAAARTAEGATLERGMAIINWMFPLGLIFTPLIDVVSGRLGIIGALQLSTVLGWAFRGLQLLPSLGAQVAAAAVYGAYRLFITSLVLAFNAHTFGPQTVGRMMGLCAVAVALVNLIQPVLVRCLLLASDQSQTVVLASLMVVSLPLPFMWQGLRWWQMCRAAQGSLERQVSWDAPRAEAIRAEPQAEV